MEMGGAMIVVMMGGMAWGIVAAIRSQIRDKRNGKSD
jgi:hypothetical protein